MVLLLFSEFLSNKIQIKRPSRCNSHDGHPLKNLLKSRRVSPVVSCLAGASSIHCRRRGCRSVQGWSLLHTIVPLFLGTCVLVASICAIPRKLPFSTDIHRLSSILPVVRKSTMFVENFSRTRMHSICPCCTRAREDVPYEIRNTIYLNFKYDGNLILR